MSNFINNYINDKEFRFTVYDNKIHIINFNKIIIKGLNLVLLKLVDNELLIKGSITSIEVLND